VPTIREVKFVKAHGTGNDFIVIPDEHGALDLTPADVAFLCDRRFGLGADGVIRVVRTQHVASDDNPLRAAEWFMDYRNADGSLAEMCGNGARVFVRYLAVMGLIDASELVIATRGGLREARIHPDRSITIDMGPATTPKARAMPQVSVGAHVWPATGVLVPNPHAVAFVGDLADAGALLQAPDVSPADVFPDGVNVEFVVEHAPDHVAMRVFERGVGETLSCGTGACAVAWAFHRRTGDPTLPVTTRVDVPGGTVEVTETLAGTLELRGPADLVARGTVLLPN
jgi:diaminopimelate epimerase